MGRTFCLDQCGHVLIRRDHVREDRDQLVTEAHHAAVLDIQINAADKFAVRTGRHDDRFANQDRFRQRIMGVARQDHVDASHDRRHLFINVKAVVA